LSCHLAFHVTRGRTIRQLAAYPALHALLEHTIHPLAARRLHLVFLVQWGRSIQLLAAFPVPHARQGRSILSLVRSLAVLAKQEHTPLSNKATQPYHALSVKFQKLIKNDRILPLRRCRQAWSYSQEAEQQVRNAFHHCA
jgi:hypothetical protein